MVHRLQSRNALVGVEGDETGEEVDFELVEGGGVLVHGHAAELGEGGLEVSELQSIGPVALVWRAKHLEDFEDLVDFTVAHKQRLALDHFREDAASRPQIDAQRVGLLTKQDLRAAVPQRDYLVRVRLDGQPESTRESEVRQLNRLTVGVDQQVLRLQVSMEDSVLVEIDERLQDLVEEALGLVGVEGVVASLAHKLLQVVLQVLEDQVKLVLRVDHFFQPSKKAKSVSWPRNRPFLATPRRGQGN